MSATRGATVLTHYSADPLTLDPTQEYEQGTTHNGKPRGLWLSDDSDYGWAEWCRAEEFGLSGLQHATRFEVDESRVLVLPSADDLRAFTEAYREESGAETFRWLTGLPIVIDWARVAAEHDGILITPYQWECRYGEDTFWYSGWDCASACIWNLAAIRQVSAEVAS